MSAKSTDLGRIQEIYDIVTQTRDQIQAIGLTREAFLNPPDDTTDLASEGVMNRIFRMTEEAGRVSADVAEAYGFDSAGARGIRNRLAHVYGDVDREIIWQVVEKDFDTLLEACEAYCEDNGIDLESQVSSRA